MNNSLPINKTVFASSEYHDPKAAVNQVLLRQKWVNDLQEKDLIGKRPVA